MRLARGLWIFCLWSGSAWAAPSSLNTVPTPDLVPLRQYNGQIQNANVSLDAHPLAFQRPILLPMLELGVTRSVEAGIDAIPGRTPGRYTAAVNLKWKPLWEDYDHPAIGIGFVQPVTDFSTTCYLVATRTLNFNAIQNQKFRAHHRNIKLRGRRVHAGVMRTPNGTFPMLGTDIEMSDQFVISSDWISGSPNAATFGGTFVIDDNNSFTAAVFYGNHEQRFNGLLVLYSHTGQW